MADRPTRLQAFALIMGLSLFLGILVSLILRNYGAADLLWRAEVFWIFIVCAATATILEGTSQRTLTIILGSIGAFLGWLLVLAPRVESVIVVVAYAVVTLTSATFASTTLAEVVAAAKQPRLPQTPDQSS